MSSFVACFLVMSLALGGIVSVSKLGRSSGSRRYMVEHADAESFAYYATGTATWRGKARALVGLPEQIRPEDFDAVYRGFHPVTLEPARRNAGAKGERPGVDLTLTVDGTVSCFWALGTREERLVAERAVDVGADSVGIEIETLTRIRIGSENRSIRALPVMADFTHFTNNIGGPQLHRHKLVFWAITADGERTGAVLFRSLYRAQKHLQSIFDAAVAAHLSSELGLRMEKTATGVRIADFPDEVVSRLCTRSQAVDEKLTEAGLSRETATVGQRKTATVATRVKKVARSTSEYFSLWRHEVEELGFSNSSLSRDFSVRSTKPELVVREAAESIAATPWTPVELLGNAAARAIGTGVEVDTLRKSAESYIRDFCERHRPSDALARLFLDINTQERAAETESSLKRLSGVKHGVSSDLVERVTRRLGVAQSEAVRGLCSKRGVEIIVGRGRDEVIEHAARAWKRSGYQVLYVNPSRAAADTQTAWFDDSRSVTQRAATESTREQILANLQPRNIAAFVWHYGLKNRSGLRELPAINSRTLVVIEQAHVVGVSTLKRLAERAEKAGAKVVLSGRNLRFLKTLFLRFGGVRAVSMKPLRCVDAATTRVAREQALKLWLRHGPKRCILIARTPLSRDRLNREAQKALRKRYRIGFSRITLRDGDRRESFHLSDRVRLRTGELATIRALHPIRRKVRVRTDSGREFLVPARRLGDLRLAYAFLPSGAPKRRIGVSFVSESWTRADVEEARNVTKRMNVFGSRHTLSGIGHPATAESESKTSAREASHA